MTVLDGNACNAAGCAGAEINGPLAVAVIGGMITSTLLVMWSAVYSLTMHGQHDGTIKKPDAVTSGFLTN
jgi:hypothetical protein